MSSIFVNNLGKKYKRFPNHWARFGELITGGLYRCHKEQWALKGISFTVRPGEAVGIIGQNGSGKSTLLKILAGTTLQSEGSYEISGRIAALRRPIHRNYHKCKPGQPHRGPAPPSTVVSQFYSGGADFPRGRSLIVLCCGRCG